MAATAPACRAAILVVLLGIVDEHIETVALRGYFKNRHFLRNSIQRTEYCLLYSIPFCRAQSASWQKQWQESRQQSAPLLQTCRNRETLPGIFSFSYRWDWFKLIHSYRFESACRDYATPFQAVYPSRLSYSYPKVARIPCRMNCVARSRAMGKLSPCNSAPMMTLVNVSPVPG